MTVHSVGVIRFPPGLFSNGRYCKGSVSNLSNYCLTIDSEKTRFFLSVDALAGTSLTLLDNLLMMHTACFATVL